ncbi:MAG: hypothetical protein RI945_179 [Candidatus Parcubacteria bacterium]
MLTEQDIKKYKTKDLLKMFFEKAQRSFFPKSKVEFKTEIEKRHDLSLSEEEETEMYLMYAELNKRAGKYDRTFL